ncbi:unnamed protein product [Hydatigera taeniaeformis]|uniref:PDZ domain-containing protein n=1 Tax=Hydatigena taeniaeformis TaxID=6205 RepID=A0A0R3WTR0_HYDTA|nr:unnamed protein product [Hydatigera taeniaeformis]
MSLNIITVTLNMDSVNFLGISIVGQSTKSGDDGIYVGSIMKGGAVAQDGRIEPGDMILEVNGISFEDMSNDDAVRTLHLSLQFFFSVHPLKKNGLPVVRSSSLLCLLQLIMCTNLVVNQGHDFTLSLNTIIIYLPITFYVFSPWMYVHEL